METLFVIKPEIVSQNKQNEIISILEKEGFNVKEFKSVHLNEEQASWLYGVHKNKPFYERLIKYITSGPIIIMIVTGDESLVIKLRDLVGNTYPDKAKVGSIRNQYGTNVTVNAVHTSDSLESAKYEVNFFYKV